MHILFLVDLSSLPDSSDAEYSLLVRALMRLSVFDAGSPTGNKCSLRFFDSLRALDHLELIRRFKGIEWSLNTDFFESWTSQHFSALVEEMKRAKSHKYNMDTSFIIHDDEELHSRTGHALQLASHRTFSEYGRTSIIDAPMVVLVTPLRTYAGAETIAHFAEAVCGSTTLFPSEITFIWLDSSGLFMNDPLASSLSCRAQLSRSKVALVEIYEVLFSDRINITLESLIRGRQSMVPLSTSPLAATQTKNEQSDLSNLINKNEIVSVEVIDMLSITDEKDGRHKVLCQLSATPVEPVKDEGNSPSAEPPTSTPSSGAPQQADELLVENTNSSHTQQEQIHILSDNESLEDFPITALLDQPRGKKYMLRCNENAISSIFLKCLEQKAYIRASFRDSIYVIVPITVGFASMFLHVPQVQADADLLLSFAQNVQITSGLTVHGAECSTILPDNMQVPTLPDNESSSVLQFSQKDAVNSSPLTGQRDLEVSLNNVRPTVESIPMMLRPMYTIPFDSSTLLPVGRGQHESVDELKQLNEGFQQLLAKLEKQEQGQQPVDTESPSTDTLPKEEHNPSEMCTEDHVKQRVALFVESISALQQEDDYPIKAGISLNALLSTFRSLPSKTLKQIRDSLLSKLEEDKNTLDLAVRVWVLSQPFVNEKQKVFQRKLYSLLGSLSISWQNSCRFTTFLNTVLSADCLKLEPTIWQTIKRRFLSDDATPQRNEDAPSSTSTPAGSNLQLRRVQSLPLPVTSSTALPQPPFAPKRCSTSLAVDSELPPPPPLAFQPPPAIPKVPLVTSTRTGKRRSLNHFVGSLANPDANFPQVVVPKGKSSTASLTGNMTTAGAAGMLQKQKIMRRQTSIFETPTAVLATPVSTQQGRFRTSTVVNKRLFDTPNSARSETPASSTLPRKQQIELRKRLNISDEAIL